MFASRGRNSGDNTLRQPQRQSRQHPGGEKNSGSEKTAAAKNSGGSSSEGAAALVLDDEPAALALDWPVLRVEDLRLVAELVPLFCDARPVEPFKLVSLLTLDAAPESRVVICLED